MEILDIILAVVLLYGLVMGVSKGLFVEAASLVSLVVGVYGAIKFSHFTADFLKTRVSWNEKTLALAAFAITFVIIIVVIALLGKLFTKLADAAALGIVNKLLGGAFGLIKVGLIMSIVLIVFTHLNNTMTFVKQETLDKSILFKPVKSLAPMIFPKIIKDTASKPKEGGLLGL
jgi:membrane protein required for colicin V production